MFHIKTIPEFEKTNNFEFENNNVEEPPEKAKCKVAKKIKKPRILWCDKFTLKKVSLPQKIEDNTKIKKKYKIQLSYNENGGKEHSKTIRFGDIRTPDYVDDRDEVKRNRVLAKLGNTHNVLHPNFWRLHLLNQGDDIKGNWNTLITNLK